MSVPFLDSRRSIYTALEDLNFLWNEDDLPAFREMWKDGRSVQEIADHFDRDPDEVVLLVIDQAREGKIKRRSTGLSGKDKV